MPKLPDNVLLQHLMKYVIDAILDLAKRLERRFYRREYLQIEQGGSPIWMPLDLPMRPRILVFKPDEIGDAVCALPALAELRRNYPDAHLAVVCQRKTAPIFEMSALVDEVVTFDVKKILRKFPRVPVSRIRKTLSPGAFDVSIFLRTYPDYFRSFLRLPGNEKIHIRDPRLKSKSLRQGRIILAEKDRAHQALQLLQVLTPLTGREYAFTDVVFPRFHFTDADRDGVDRAFPGGRPRGYIVVHPFADFETRRYPETYWVSIIEDLRRRYGLPIVTIGGPQDPRLPLKGLVELQGKLTLKQTAALISDAAIFMGNLSGPAHLAGAIGTPSVTLMSGHSSSKEWGPLGRSLLLRMQVACSPCHLRRCYQYGLACLTELTPPRVLPEIHRFAEKHLPSTSRPKMRHLSLTTIDPPPP